MGQDQGVDIPCSEENKGREEAKKGGIRELKQGPEDGHRDRGVRVGQPKLVEMVDVGNAKVEWGQEDYLLPGEMRQNM